MSILQPPLRVVQITDPHLFADPQGRLKGVDTQASFEDCLALAREEPPELFLLTGDLVHDESRAGYQRLCDALQSLPAPVYCLPGNHDSGPLIGELLNQGRVHTRRTVHHDDWLFVFLDSSVPGSAAGRLSGSEMAALEERINGNDARHVLVCVHHNPLPVGSRWLDTMTIENGEDLVRLCQHHPKVRGILFGHIHQAFDQPLDDLQLIGSPSTCIQFKPHSNEFALEARAPGYRVLELHDNGHIDSRIVRLEAVPAGLDLGPEGY